MQEFMMFMTLVMWHKLNLFTCIELILEKMKARQNSARSSGLALGEKGLVFLLSLDESVLKQ